MVPNYFVFVLAAVIGATCSSQYEIDGQAHSSTNDTFLEYTPPLEYTAGLAGTANRTFRELVLDFKELQNASLSLQSSGKSRRKRSIFNLLSMIGCATDCSRWDLISYGNYCGWGGSGPVTDNVDRCCKRHDDCYSYVMNRYDKWAITLYYRSYYWHCNGGDPYCSSYQESQWKRATCNCDLQFNQCLIKYGCPYRVKNIPYIYS